MKKIFKKNQLIITGLALMIAAAGYLSYSSKGITNEAKKEENQNLAKEEYEISDEDIAEGDIVTDTEDTVADAEGMTTEEAEEANPGEAVLTSTGAATVDFAAEARTLLTPFFIVFKFNPPPAVSAT